MIRWLAAWLLCAAPLAAEPDFAAFAQEHGIAPASLTVLHPDGSVLISTAAGQAVTDPAPILSISKTLAGVCVMHAVRVGQISLDDTVALHLGWAGPSGGVTIAQLVTHSSGYRPDRTQRDVLGRFLDRPASVDRLVRKRAEDDLGEPGYFYNNENFIVLERVLDAALGEPALDWCLREVPALAAMTSLKIAEGYEAIGLAGGLAVTTPELARLMSGMTPAADWPEVQIDDTVTYGPGIVMVGGRLIHRGGMCLLTGWGHGAVAAKDGLGYAVAFTYTGCPDQRAEAALQSLLEAAIRAD